jgi:MYXO-CTERM domain-containing protein
MKWARGWWVLLIGASGLVGSVSDAAGKPGDKQAEKLISAAMDTDYGAGKFDAARAKLDKAARTVCARRRCTKSVHATVYGYLAVVHGIGDKDMDQAKVDIKRMLEIDSSALLDEQFSNKELRDAFFAIKKPSAAAAPETETAAPEPKTDDRAAKAEAARAAAEEKKAASRSAADEKKEAARAAAAEKKEAAQAAAEEKRVAAEASRAAAEEKKEAQRKAAEEKREALRQAEAERKTELARKAEEARKAADEKRLRTPPPVGALQGTVWKEGVIGYPLPIFVKLPPPPQGIEPARVQVAKVTVTYSTPTVAVPTPAEMKLVEAGLYSFLIPCEATKQEGDVLYNVSALNKYDNPVATSGTIDKPNRVTLKVSINGAMPHLPGEVPPEACGAKSAASQKGKCTENLDCEIGEYCVQNKCVPGDSPLLAKSKKKGMCASCEVGAADAPTPVETLFAAALVSAAVLRRRRRSK